MNCRMWVPSIEIDAIIRLIIVSGTLLYSRFNFLFADRFGVVLLRCVDYPALFKPFNQI